MTREALGHSELPALVSGNAALDEWAYQVQRRFAEVFESVNWLIGEDESFEAGIAGSGTAGTYEIATQRSRYYRIGDFVFVSVYIVLAAAITAGGVGNLLITGLPLAKVGVSFPVGSVVLVGVNWTAGANLSCSFVSSSAEGTSLLVQETNDNAVNTNVGIAGVAADDFIIASICYVTSGERSE